MDVDAEVARVHLVAELQLAAIGSIRGGIGVLPFPRLTEPDEGPTALLGPG